MAKKIGEGSTSQIDCGTYYDCSNCRREIVEVNGCYGFEFCPWCGAIFNDDENLNAEIPDYMLDAIKTPYALCNLCTDRNECKNHGHSIRCTLAGWLAS